MARRTYRPCTIASAVVAFLFIHSKTTGIHANSYSNRDFRGSVTNELPQFVGRLKNSSVPVGRDAVFSCNVRGLGKYRVGWVKADTKAIQSLHDKVITYNPRVKVSGDLSTTFNLHIEAVEIEDRGVYMCQVNTDPMIWQTAVLDVRVPPDVDVKRSSPDVEVKAGANAKLECYAHGVPPPSVSWQREDKKPIKAKDPITGLIHTYDEFNGSSMTIPKVQPGDLGAYLCIARNGVPPMMSKRVFLYVQYAPRITSPTKVMGVAWGSDVRIDCEVSAHPKPIIYWNFKGSMVITGDSYTVEERRISASETVSTLVIKRVARHKQQMGRYTCVASNSLGADEKDVNIYLNPEATAPPTEEPSSPSTSTTLMTTDSRGSKGKGHGNRRRDNKRRKNSRKKALREKNRAQEDGNEGIGLTQLDIHQEDFRNEYSFGNDVGRVHASSRGLILFAVVMLTQVLSGQDLSYC